ncbi:hypothetical protein, partial [Amaricoccus sp.]|uniref:hypothetical protein n=1 Tax=Amaricoccus sp. TaxID=1872485 RepID=UPI001B43A2E3
HPVHRLINNSSSFLPVHLGVPRLVHLGLLSDKAMSKETGGSSEIVEGSSGKALRDGTSEEIPDCSAFGKGISQPFATIYRKSTCAFA